MASDRLKELFQEVESLADSYGKQSTRLSNQIYAFEKRLTDLKGKVLAEAKDKAGLRLGFVSKLTLWRV